MTSMKYFILILVVIINTSLYFRVDPNARKNTTYGNTDSSSTIDPDMVSIFQSTLIYRQTLFHCPLFPTYLPGCGSNKQAPNREPPTKLTSQLSYVEYHVIACLLVGVGWVMVRTLSRHIRSNSPKQQFSKAKPQTTGRKRRKKRLEQRRGVSVYAHGTLEYIWRWLIDQRNSGSISTLKVKTKQSQTLGRCLRKRDDVYTLQSLGQLENKQKGERKRLFKRAFRLISKYKRKMAELDKHLTCLARAWPWYRMSKIQTQREVALLEVTLNILGRKLISLRDDNLCAMQQFIQLHNQCLPSTQTCMDNWRYPCRVTHSLDVSEVTGHKHA